MRSSGRKRVVPIACDDADLDPNRHRPRDYGIALKDQLLAARLAVPVVTPQRRRAPARCLCLGFAADQNIWQSVLPRDPRDATAVRGGAAVVGLLGMQSR